MVSFTSQHQYFISASAQIIAHEPLFTVHGVWTSPTSPTNSNAMETTSLGRFNRLPRELRDTIYKFVLTTNPERDLSGPGSKNQELGIPSLSTKPSLSAMEPGLLCASSQLRNETLSIYYSQSFVMTVNWKFDVALLIRILKKKPVSTLQMMTDLTLFSDEFLKERHIHSRFGLLEELAQSLVGVGFSRDRLIWTNATGFPLCIKETQSISRMEDCLSFEMTAEVDSEDFPD